MILRKFTNPKGSNVDRVINGEGNATPSGSNLLPRYLGYKYANPSDCELANNIKANL